MTGSAVDQRGRFWRDASGRLTFELHRVDAKDYPAVCKLLVREFDLQPWGQLVDGWDVLFREFRARSGLVSIEWDNWTGFTVVAKNEGAEPAVKEMATFLEASPAIVQFIRPA